MSRKSTLGAAAAGIVVIGVVLAWIASVWLASEPVARAQLGPAPPSEVFRYDASASPTEIRLDFHVADGGYLYRDRFAFDTADPRVTLGVPRFPAGETHEDEFFGRQEVYRDEFEIAIPYTLTAAADSVDLALALQGCDENLGLCYPPQNWTAMVELPETAVGLPGTVGNPPAISAIPSAGGLSGSLFAGAASDEPLPVDQAFVGNARFDAANELTVSWQIAPGYYLYRDEFSFAVDGGIQFGAARLPEGVEQTDQYFGDTEVYYDYVELVVPFARASPDEQALAITVGYRGCKVESICYPPSEQLFELSLPPTSEFASSPGPNGRAAPGTAAAGAATTGSTTLKVSEQDRFAALITGGSWLAFLGAFYVAGLALSLTPCVLPMVPILSSIIAGQGKQVSTQRGFWLSASYVLGMAATYTVAGALTALAGSQIQAIFQKPWIIVSFAGVFVLMALGMFGLFEIQMPTAIQSRLSQLANRQKGGTFLGTAIVGALTALIVTTCVAPPLIGALAVIGQTGDVTRGAAALFVLAIGMGTPLLLVGASAGRLLPRVGPWMNTVKAGFGVVMMGLAIYMLERVLPGTVILMLWALLVFLTGVFLGAFDTLPQDPQPVRRLAKGLGMLACLYGAILLIGATLGGENPLRPIPRLALGAGGAEASRGAEFLAVESVGQLETLLGQARAAGQPVMIDFTADWCAVCKEMEEYTFPDPAVVAALKPFMLLRVDVTENDDADQALMSSLRVVGAPAMIFHDRAGAEIDPYRLYGFLPADEFAAHVSEVAAM